ncbi:MAG: RHS repeat-associated core domain-containing protein [Saprospiraceae bacterium]|nr:RHS repeat-associated core domain-containing protein [Saprospiraceae bacterium]
MNGYTDISNGTNVSNHYDANGNMLSDGAKNYNFDIENRLITINAGSTASYTYDALGRRIKKVTGSKVINFYFEGLQVIEERNESDVLQTSYVWGTWLDDIVMMKRNGNNFYYLSNTIGSVVAVTDAQGAIVERYEYDAFGKVQFYNNNYEAVSQSSIGNNYTFTGREYEVEIGNYFYRTRHFDVTQGRFLQKDPIGFIGGDQNLYTYVKNQPAFYNDPLGLKSNNGGNSSNYSQAFNNANTNVCRLDNDWNKAEGYDILNSGIYQPLSTITQSLDQFNRVLGYNGRRFISRELWMATGYGPGRFLKSWNSFFNNASKFGNGLGWIGQGVSTFNYFGNGNTTVAQDFNFLIGSGLTIAPIVATAIGAPVVITAVAALSIGYGIIQTASFFISNGTKSFEDIYFENRNTTNKIRLP